MLHDQSCSHSEVQAKDRKKQLTKRLGRPINLDGQYEDIIAQEVVNPQQIDVTLRDVGGLDDIIDDLRRNIITPMRRPEHFRTSLLRQKRGVLLYGPPGTGKTMLAKALARECGACFINLKSSTVLSKWYGDTNKLIHAVWTLSYKLQPTILFIDEVDSLLGARRSTEHEATTSMKTEFMQLWEGFETMPNNNVVVLGATNKRDALDDAVLRRFSLQYEVKLPGKMQREAILKLMLQRHLTEMGPKFVDDALKRDLGYVVPNGMGPESTSMNSDISGSPVTSSSGGGNERRAARLRPLRDIAERTQGFSGSDLAELCSQAAAIPVHEYIAAMEKESDATPELQPLSKLHFEQVLAHMEPPSRAAQAVRTQRRRYQRNSNGVATENGRGSDVSSLLSEADLLQLATAIASGLRRGVAVPIDTEAYPLDDSDEDTQDEDS